MKNKKCPFCEKEIESDASISKACGLCGMGILEPGNTPAIVDPSGEKIYFCCQRCRKIYLGSAGGSYYARSEE